MTEVILLRRRLPAALRGTSRRAKEGSRNRRSEPQNLRKDKKGKKNTEYRRQKKEEEKKNAFPNVK
jgi:hypothetical protein